MQLTPSLDDFCTAYAAGRNQIVYTRLAADLDTPVSLMLKLTKDQKDAFLLESVTGGEIRGRYSIIGMKPDLIWQCHGTQSRINRDAQRDARAFVGQDADPLHNLRILLEESHIDLPKDLPQASAGLFGYLGYDMIRLIETLPHINPDPLGLPDACLYRPSVVVVVDGVKGDVIIVASAWNTNAVPAHTAYQQAADRVTAVVRDLATTIPQVARESPHRASTAEDAASASASAIGNFTKANYLAAVEKARDYTRAGEVFQLVLSQRWVQDFCYPPFALYRSLRRTNPSPFMFYFNFGGYQVVGASPEILVRVFDRRVTIRPIAGTRPRGATTEQDKQHERDLLSDAKECAEHLMLLDLGRNDVGRVARVGSVRPTEQFTIERYSHVMHIVSNVEGELAEGRDALDAFFAGMPAGTVSGAPKVRAMELIDALEPEKRGIYGGGVGYFSSGGDMDICIALRTAIVKNGQVYIQAGGGVVYDSDPETEYMETLHKSNALRRAAADAAFFSGNLGENDRANGEEKTP
ncbi:MAG: anthranilate synthase component I [Rhodobacteraceae bacterium]|nr:anthranilate synthase component I [Paracoccaceae bacterium]